MKRKIIGPIVFMLLTTCVLLPATGTTITKQTNNQPITADIEWWPMFHHDLRITGYTPGDSPDMNNKIWDKSIDNDIFFSSPAIVDDHLVIGTGFRYYDKPREQPQYKQFYDTELLMKDKTFLNVPQQQESPRSAEVGKLYCLNAKTGAIQWDFNANGSVFSAPVIDNSKVYFVSADSNNYSGEMYCLNLETGSEVWSIPMMSGFATPAIQDSMIYVITLNPENYNGRLQCLDAADGSEIWNHTTGYIDFSMYTAPALAEGKVFFSSVDVTSGIHCKMTCLNQSTGQLLWATKMSAEMNFGYALSSPVITEQKAYMISAATKGTEEFWCELSCLDTSNGSILWNYTMRENTKDEMSFAHPAVAYGNVYFTAMEANYLYGKLYCFNGENGSVQWVRKTQDLFTLCSPVLSDGKLFVGALNMSSYKTNLYCLNAYTGNPLYDAQIMEYFIDSTPAIADDAVYIGANSGMGTSKIYAFKDPFKVGDIQGGFFGVKLDITNTGDTDVEDISYTMAVTGGLLGLINKEVNSSITILEAGTTDTIKVSPIFGLGKLHVTATVSYEGITPVTREAEGFILGVYVIIT
jgi:outer membrane protein assembly factor BamB